jgi:EmrB/QacA subfamily drug resistance transporter
MEEGPPVPSRSRFGREVIRPDRIRQWDGAAWLAVVAVAFGALMSQVDASIVTVAYPTLQRQFHVTVGAVTWVGLAYMLTSVSTIVILGRFSDMVGRKLIYTYGFMVFLLGSVLCGLAPSLWFLVASRILQAVGGAMIQANSVAIVVLAVAKNARTKGLGFQAAAQATGLALGPTIGGLMLGVLSWRWLFLVNIPIGLIALPCAMLFIPRSRYLAPRQRLDWTGVVLLFMTITSLMASLSFADRFGWSSPIILGGFVLFVVAGIGFLALEGRVANPLITPELLGSPVIRRGLVAAILSYLVLFALLFLVPFQIERGLGASTAAAGLVLLSLPLAIAVIAPFAGAISRVLGETSALVGASLAMALGVVVVALSGGSLAVLVAGLGLAGLGIGVFNTINNADVMGAVPAHETAVGSGMLNMARGIGTALGLAAGGALFVGLGGSAEVATKVQAAFTSSSWFLVGTALVAGVLGSSAALRTSRPVDVGRLGA